MADATHPAPPAVLTIARIDHQIVLHKCVREFSYKTRCGANDYFAGTA